MMESKLKQYDDIINFSHHISKKHSPMSRINRASQFSAFAALSGYESLIDETARLTDEKSELTDDEIFLLNNKLQILSDRIYEQPVAEIIYFLPDEIKTGGSYKTIIGCVRAIDEYDLLIILNNGIKIPIYDIYSIKIYD